MGKSKRNKLMKAFGKSDEPPPPTPFIIDGDDDLMSDLLNQLDSRDQTVQVSSATLIQEISVQESSGSKDRKQDSKSRFQARQARKVEALVANFSKTDPALEAKLIEETKAEEKAINRICDELGVRIHEINPDGHCLFSAIGDQLALLSVVPSDQRGYATIRATASSYMFSHINDFLPFLPSTESEDGMMSPKSFEQYCVSIRDTGVWGGEPEILALSRAYNVPIHVVQGGSPPIVIHNPVGGPNHDPDIRAKRVVRISYHRRRYGLGEHYNSLRPKSLA